jgi:hypothetical protein
LAVKQMCPGGTATPHWASSCLAWYSWMFKGFQKGHA